ncbi:MAG: hypothetical protein R3213_10440, partial [Flavobacteriaceae bacterium]|nr:hypothetical protein [Flavobacteriaceae bacterium]
LCLGKQAVVFDYHVHRDYCTSDNSFLVPHNRKMIEARDEVFFDRGAPFNQGEWADWDEDEFLDQCAEAEKVAKDKNKEGQKLAKQFTYENTLKDICGILK